MSRWEVVAVDGQNSVKNLQTLVVNAVSGVLDTIRIGKSIPRLLLPSHGSVPLARDCSFRKRQTMVMSGKTNSSTRPWILTLKISGGLVRESHGDTSMMVCNRGVSGVLEMPIILDGPRQASQNETSFSK